MNTITVYCPRGCNVTEAPVDHPYDECACCGQTMTTESEDIDPDYWYEHQHMLECDWVFETRTGEIVRLDRRVPGDGTKWYVVDWLNGWYHYDSTIEPGDLKTLLNKDGLFPAKERPEIQEPKDK